MAEQEYLKSASHDELFRMIEILTNEVWVLRDRLTSLEALLQSSGALDRSALEHYVAAGEIADELDRERRWLVARVFGEPIGIPATPIAP